MEIYGELLFFENMITGVGLIHLTAKAVGKKPRKFAAIWGGALCGVYSFIVIFPLSRLTCVVTEIIFALGLVLLVFPKAKPANVIKECIVFILLTMLLGGVATAFLLGIGQEAVLGYGSFYTGPASYGFIAAALTFAYAAARLALLMMRRVRGQARTRRQISLTWGETTIQVEALVDSANFLRDPATGAPVAICEEQVFAPFLRDIPESERSSRYLAVPFHGLDGHGIMEGYRLDCMVDKEGMRCAFPVVALCPEGTISVDQPDVGMLLNECMLERSSVDG